MRTEHKLRIDFDLDDDERAALAGLCDSTYCSIQAVLQYLACSAAAYVFAARGKAVEAEMMARAARHQGGSSGRERL